MSESESDDHGSVTSLAEASVVRERAPEIQRGDLIAGRYQVEAIIGKGGSGIVVRAFDRTAQMPVALKILRPDLANDERWAQRFARELRLGRPIRHPNVCRIFDIGEADGHKFLTMELAAHGTLRDLIKAGGPLRPLPERMADAAAAIAGLAAIHEAGIVHRDVKPDNMLRMEEGHLALSDFGLATDLSNTGTVTVMVGTPHYMAPEIRAGEPATTRSDVWSLGVVLYEIFFGVRPERKSSKSQAGFSRPPAPLTSSSLERAMLALAELCLAEDPIERPSDATKVAQLFASAGSAPRRFPRSRWGLRLAVAGTVLTVAAGGGWMVRQSQKVPKNYVRYVSPAGTAASWNTVARPVISLKQPIHCVTLLNDDTVRVVIGSPRRAEDVAIATGVRRDAGLLPETYATGCPQESSNGRLLFATTTISGSSEIRLSSYRDGREAVPIATGSDPFWLKRDEKFVYDVDASHPAVFSLPTMSFVLLPDPGIGGHNVISEKAVSHDANTIAVSFIMDDASWAVSLYDEESTDLKATVRVPPTRDLHFTRDGGLLVPYDLSASNSTITRLDWKVPAIQQLGKYDGLEIFDAQVGTKVGVLTGHRIRKDVYQYEDGRWRQLTTDGENYSAAISPSGALAMSKRGADGTFTIWLTDRDGVARQVTNGPADVMPALSADGRFLAYVDHQRRSIVLCENAGASCRPLRQDQSLQVWPRFSPDGKMLAYLTQGQGPRLGVISLADGSAATLGAALWQCPEVWSSDHSIWSLEGARGRYAWHEREVPGGTKTGRQIEADVSLEEGRCRNARERPDSPVFERLRIDTEETSSILRIDGDRLR